MNLVIPLIIPIVHHPVKMVNQAVDTLLDGLTYPLPKRISRVVRGWHHEIRYLASSLGTGLLVSYLGSTTMPLGYRQVTKLFGLAVLGDSALSNGLEYHRRRVSQLAKDEIIISCALGLIGAVPYAITLSRYKPIDSYYSLRAISNGVNIFNIFSTLFTFGALWHLALRQMGSGARLERDRKTQREIKARLIRTVNQFRQFLTSDAQLDLIFSDHFIRFASQVPTTYPVHEPPIRQDNCIPNAAQEWARDMVNNSEIQRGLKNLVDFIKRHGALLQEVRHQAETSNNWDQWPELKTYMITQFDFSFPESQPPAITDGKEN